MEEIDKLASLLEAAKTKEDAAKAERIAAEQAIIEALGAKDEGSESHKGEFFKLTITGKVNRSVDLAAWDAIKAHIPEKYWPIKFKPEIDTTGLKWLKDHEAGIYATACQAISAKPGKPSVALQRIEEKQ